MRSGVTIEAGRLSLARYIPGMNRAQTAKIEVAVTECLDDCDPHMMPFTSIDKFIARLKADPNWTDAEIVELQSRVIRAILARQNALR